MPDNVQPYILNEEQRSLIYGLLAYLRMKEAVKAKNTERADKVNILVNVFSLYTLIFINIYIYGGCQLMLHGLYTFPHENFINYRYFIVFFFFSGRFWLLYEQPTVDYCGRIPTLKSC